MALDSAEVHRIAKVVVRMLYVGGVINGDQFVKALACVEAATKFIDMGATPDQENDNDAENVQYVQTR